MIKIFLSKELLIRQLAIGTKFISYNSEDPLTYQEIYQRIKGRGGYSREDSFGNYINGIQA